MGERFDCHALDTTVAREFSLEGPGLHTGETARVTLRPAPPGHGVVFVRPGSTAPVRIPARVEYVSSTRNATTLAAGEVAVSTVEHLLAALWAAGIDDVEIDVDGSEVPVLDGSAQPFAAALRHAGRRVRVGRPRARAAAPLLRRPRALPL